MIQTQAPFTQFPQETPFQDFASDLSGPNEFFSPSDENFEDFSDYEYDQYIEGEEEISEDEEDDGTRVYYQIPANAKKPDLREQKLKAERLRERNQKLQERCKKRKFLNFSPEFDQDSVSLKNISRLSRPRKEVRNICYMPDMNLLLVILMDGRTMNVYSMLNFKLVVVKNLSKSVTAISYSPYFKKILVGGDQGLIQILNPITFQVENEVAQGYYYYYYYYNQSIHTIKYVPKHNIIVAVTESGVSIYDTNLNWLDEFSPPRHFGTWKPCSSEIFAISKDRLLIPCQFEERKILTLINLKTDTVKAFLQVYIPNVSCIEITENDILKTFVSLVGSNSRNRLEQVSFQMAEMTLSCKTEELVISKRTASLHSFTVLQRIENSRLFFAQGRISEDESKDVLLTITKEKIEIVRVFSESWRNLAKCLILMKDGFSVAEMSYWNRVSVIGMIFRREKRKKLKEENEKN